MQVLPTCWDVEKKSGTTCIRMSALSLTIRSFGPVPCKTGITCVRIVIPQTLGKNLMIPPRLSHRLL